LNNDISFSDKLAVKLGPISLKNPVIMSSGTFGNGIEYSEFYDISILGAVITKSFSLKPMLGNEPPRLCETTAGLLNSIGLQNEGIEYFINEQIKLVKKLKINIILSILGANLLEFSEIAAKVKKIEENLIAVELNLSCPNVKEGGITLGSIPESVEEITLAVKKILDIPVIVKLSPNNDNYIEVARSAKNGGASCISLINTITGMAIDIKTFKPKLGSIVGGLSGPAIKPIAIAKVYSLYKANILPIIGMGGIFNWEDAIEFILAGANAIGIGTANFVNYNVGKDTIQGIYEFLIANNIKDINSLVGKVKIN